MLTVKNWGYLTTLGHFEIVVAENGEKPKSGISITQPLWMTVLPHSPLNNCFWGWEISRIGEKYITLHWQFFKIKDGSQLWPIEVSILYLCKRRVPMVVATKRVCVTSIPFWNICYWFKHAKTNIWKVFCIYWWQIGLVNVQIVGYIAPRKPSSKCGPWKK